MSASSRTFSLLTLLLASACSSSASPNAAQASADDDAGSGATPAATAPALADAAAAETSTGVDAPAGRDAAEGAEAGTDPGAPLTTIRVHYPAGSHTIALRGSVSPWSWTTGATMTSGPDGTFTLSSRAVTGAFQFKPMLDDATWSLGPNYSGVPGGTVDVYPRFTQVAGTWSLAYQFKSAILGNTRGIYVYLPPTYIENTLASMPVVYMHDGQNLFDPAASFDGNTWKVQQAMDAAAVSGASAEALVIGVDNTDNRIAEYTPVADPSQNPSGGGGEQYLQMLVTELKPHVDATLRTIPDREHTFMIGSSLGGLITAYAGVTHADVFGFVGSLSPSTWWDSDWLIGDVGTTPASPRPVRVYVDSGNAGPGHDDLTQTRKLAAQYRKIGYANGSTLDYVVQDGGQHSEIYWAERLPGTLAFLLGPGR